MLFSISCLCVHVCVCVLSPHPWNQKVILGLLQSIALGSPECCWVFQPLGSRQQWGHTGPHPVASECLLTMQTIQRSCLVQVMLLIRGSVWNLVHGCEELVFKGASLPAWLSHPCLKASWCEYSFLFQKRKIVYLLLPTPSTYGPLASSSIDAVSHCDWGEETIKKQMSHKR